MTETIEHAGATATTNFANSMRDALAALPPAVIAPPTPNEPAPSVPTAEPAKQPAVAPAKEPTKVEPTAQSPEPDVEKWPRTAQEWKKWNEVRASEYKKRDDEIARWKGEHKTLEEKLKTVGTPAQHPEYESVKKERDQFSEVLKTIAVENHPKFKEYYDSRVTSQVDLAKRVAGADKSDAIAKALSLPDGEFRDRQIEELVDDLPPIKQAQIGSILNSLSEIQNERQTEVVKARANYDKLQAEQVQKATAVRTQLETKFNDTVTKLKSSNPLYQSREKDDAWNKDVNDRVEMAKHFLLGNPTTDQVIEAAANAAAFPALIQNQLAIIKENESLKAQIKSLSTATPTISGKAPETTGTTSTVVIPATSRPMEAAAAFFKGLPALGQQSP